MSETSGELNLTALKGAVNALEDTIKNWEQYNRTKYGINEFLHSINEETGLSWELMIRSAVIQNFEIAYETCWKFMKKWLELNTIENTRTINRREFYRICVQNKLIDDISAWWNFHEARNKTSHTYKEEIAEEVFEIAFEFLPYAQKLIEVLEA